MTPPYSRDMSFERRLSDGLDTQLLMRSQLHRRARHDADAKARVGPEDSGPRVVIAAGDLRCHLLLVEDLLQQQVAPEIADR